MSKTIQFPLAWDQWAQIEWPRPVSREEWERFWTILQLMKPGFVPEEKVTTPAEEQP